MIIAAENFWQSETIELFVLDETDATDKYVGWLNDTNVNRYLESRFATHSIESTRDFIRACRASDNTLFLGIRHVDEGHIGNIKVDVNPVHKFGEVGIMIGEPIYGRGVGSEAIGIVVEIARRNLMLRKLGAGCYASNIGSEKAFEKCGFSVEGRRPQHFLLDGKAEDMVLMGLIL